MKVYDCFQFNNELELLEIRLNHHDSFVDKFVLSECLYTYSGEEKRLFYDEVKEKSQFKKFKDKIIHFVIEDPPDKGREGWEYEHFQRNMLYQNMIDIFSDDDLILYLDCDEMIRDKSVIEKASATREMVNLDMKLCWYYFNCIIAPGSPYQGDYSMEPCFEGRWHMGKICRKEHIERFKSRLYSIREFNLWSPKNMYTIFDSGWHFSNLGTSKRILEKLNSFSHKDELNSRYSLTDELIKERRDNLRDPLGRNVSFVATELDVPGFILKNIDKYKDYILDVPDSE